MISDHLELQRAGTKCTVEVIRGKMTVADRDDFDGHLTAGTPAAAIARALKVDGFSVSQGSVQRHRRGDCACP